MSRCVSNLVPLPHTLRAYTACCDPPHLQVDIICNGEVLGSDHTLQFVKKTR